MGLITRILPPNAKGFKLTFSEMDNNLYYLQGLGVSGLTFVGSTLTLTNPTGGTKTTKIETSSRTIIPSGTTITIENDFQYFVYGDLVVQGILNVQPNAEVITLNGNLIASGGTINLSGTSQSITLPSYNTFVTGATLNQLNDDVTFTGNFGFNPFTLDLSPLKFTGGTISGKTNFISGVSINTLSATTIDLCSTNGTLYTDSISGCSPINFLSQSNFTNGLSATTISGSTFYGDGSNLIGVVKEDIFVTGGTFSAGTATFTNTTGGTFDVTGFTSGNVSENYLPLSGGTVTGNTDFTQSLTSLSLSATTISGNTLYGDGSNLTNINGFITTAITLTSSQILTMGTPIELLPSPGINKYYVIDRVQMEYSYGTTAYVFPSSATFYLDGCFDSYITKTILTDSQNTVCVINGNLRNTITIGAGSGSVQIITNKDVLNSNLIIGTPNGDNPTNGDGSLRIKITYKVETFGS